MATTTRKTPSKTTQAAKAAGAKTPQDRQTASRDAENELLDFTYHDETYQIDTDKADDLDFLVTLNQNPVQALVHLLGDDDFQRLYEQLKDISEEATGKRQARVTDMRDFLQKVMAETPLGI